MIKKLKHHPALGGYAFSRRFISMRIALLLIFISLVGGMTGFCLLEGYTILEGFYMSIITISTVGYTEVKPLTSSGQIFSSILIILNIGIFAYIFYTFSYYIIEGKLFERLYLKRVMKQIEKLENHIIVCGCGKHGQEIVDYFLHHGQDFVVIEHNPETIEQIQRSEQKILYIEGDATQDEILMLAGIQKAKGLISSLGDDTLNLYAVLTARQMSSKLNIISRAFSQKSESKLLLAGANHVIMPELIGGYFMAALVNKPKAVEFFSFITNEYDSDMGFEELDYEKVSKNFQDKSIRNMQLRQKTGVNIIGFKNQQGKYIVNPGPDTVLQSNTSFIILGSVDQLDRMREIIKE